MNTKSCISCGLPIRHDDEAASGDPNRPYCHLCARPDGSMKSFEEVHQGMTRFMIETQGLDEEIAGRMAREMMEKLPAWKELASP